MERTWIDQYETGGAVLGNAVRGLSEADLLAHPFPQMWSIQQIVLHLMDSDLIWTVRAKCVIAQDKPLFASYDESAFASALHYDQQSVDDAITVFDLNRRNFSRVLRALPDSAFDRAGVHPEIGVITLGQMVQRICEHVGHHLKFIAEKRAILSADRQP